MSELRVYHLQQSHHQLKQQRHHWLRLPNWLTLIACTRWFSGTVRAGCSAWEDELWAEHDRGSSEISEPTDQEAGCKASLGKDRVQRLVRVRQHSSYPDIQERGGRSKANLEAKTAGLGQNHRDIRHKHSCCTVVELHGWGEQLSLY